MYAPPPPPYIPPQPLHVSSASAGSRPGPGNDLAVQRKGLPSLPLHLIHRILSLTLDQRATPSKFWSDPEEERVRRIWALFRGLRGVNRMFWLVSTSILRSMYLESYLSYIKPGYSSDPFPYDSSTLSDPDAPIYYTPEGGEGVYAGRRRETGVLDRFIAVMIGEELRRVESALSEGSEAVGDIFNRLQPAARIEDLLLTLPATYIIPSLSPSSSGSSGIPRPSLPLPQSHLSVTLTPTWAGLYLHSHPVSLALPFGAGGGSRGKGGGRVSRDLVVEVRRRDTLEGTLKMLEDALDDLQRRLVPWGGRVG